jgi:hypothetical protein
MDLMAAICSLTSFEISWGSYVQMEYYKAYGHSVYIWVPANLI